MNKSNTSLSSSQITEAETVESDKNQSNELSSVKDVRQDFFENYNPYSDDNKASGIIIDSFEIGPYGLSHGYAVEGILTEGNVNVEVEKVNKGFVGEPFTDLVKSIRSGETHEPEFINISQREFNSESEHLAQIKKYHWYIIENPVSLRKSSLGVR